MLDPPFPTTGSSPGSVGDQNDPGEMPIAASRVSYRHGWHCTPLVWVAQAPLTLLLVRLAFALGAGPVADLRSVVSGLSLGGRRPDRPPAGSGGPARKDRAPMRDSGSRCRFAPRRLRRCIRGWRRRPPVSARAASRIPQSPFGSVSRTRPPRHVNSAWPLGSATRDRVPRPKAWPNQRWASRRERPGAGRPWSEGSNWLSLDGACGPASRKGSGMAADTACSDPSAARRWRAGPQRAARRRRLEAPDRDRVRWCVDRRRRTDRLDDRAGRGRLGCASVSKPSESVRRHNGR